MKSEQMYIFGKITAVAEQYGDFTPAIFDKFVSSPLATLGIIKNREEWKAAMRNDGEELAALFAKIPADIADPKGGVKIEEQGSFWIGYYHRKHLNSIKGELTPEYLAEAGELLFGEHWQTPMAEALGLSDTARMARLCRHSLYISSVTGYGIALSLLAKSGIHVVLSFRGFCSYPQALQLSDNHSFYSLHCVILCHSQPQ